MAFLMSLMRGGNSLSSRPPTTPRESRVKSGPSSMDDTASLLPTHSSPHKRNGYTFGKFAIVTVGLPFFAFSFCVYWSTKYNFRESTATHCQVDNYLPSVSAAIGSFSPQKYVWMVAILVHFVPRLAIARHYFEYLRSIVDPQCYFLVKLNWLCNVVEVTCLLGLTLVSSTAFYPAHAFFFVTFIIMSIIYMILSCYLLKRRRSVPANNVEARSWLLKFLCCSITLIFFLLAGFCFVRHNTYCEAGVYSMFALCEYVVVLSNMAFHLTAYLDFHDRVVYFSSGSFSIATSRFL